VDAERPGHDAFAALRFPDFRHLVGATFLITCALMIQRVALGYELYLLTRDPLSLGLLGLAEALPFMGLALFGGHLADRRNKQHLLQAAGAIFMIGSALLLAAGSSTGRAHLGDDGLAHAIYLTVFIEGLARGFYHPASASLRPFLIPRSHYGNATTWNSTAWQVGAILGPAAGGFLYAGLGLSGTLWAVLGLLGLNILLIGRIRPPRAATQTENHNGLWDSLREGLAELRARNSEACARERPAEAKASAQGVGVPRRRGRYAGVQASLWRRPRRRRGGAAAI
jgi:MFS family permease